MRKEKGSESKIKNKRPCINSKLSTILQELKSKKQKCIYPKSHVTQKGKAEKCPL